MTDGTLFTGKTVEDAVAEGLRSLGLTQDQVEVEVISRGSRGLFGIGSEPAQVRLTPRAARAVPPAAVTPPTVTTPTVATPTRPMTPAAEPPAPAKEETTPVVPSTVAAAMVGSGDVTAAADVDDAVAQSGGEESAEPAASDLSGEVEAGETGAEAGAASDADEEEMAALAVELLSETVRHMGFDAEVLASWQEPDADNDDRYLLLNLQGRDLGALIGRRGETLGNLQYLLRLMVNQRLHQWKNIVVDVEQYRQRRAEHLVQLALRSADQVAKTGRALSLEPMPPNERRIIHLALRDHAGVYTESSGEGERRKIQILPKRI